MTIFEILNEMGNLSETHDVLIEVNRFGVIIRKYFECGGKPNKFNQAFSFEIFKHKDLEDCILEFERRLEKELVYGKRREIKRDGEIKRT